MKRRYFALGFVAWAIAACSSPKDKLIGKWQSVNEPLAKLEFLADGKVIYTKDGKLKAGERTGIVKKWEIIEGDRLLIDGGKAVKFKIDNNTLSLGDSPKELKYNKLK
jgi:hypothetical protein